MGWWITLAVLVALALFPLTIRFKYNADGMRLIAIAGFVPITILPSKKKEKKSGDEADSGEDKKSKKSKKSPKAKKPKKEQKSGKAPEAAGETVTEQTTASAPATGQESKPSAQASSDEEEASEKDEKETKKESGGSWKDFLGFIPIVLNFLGDFVGKLRVNRLELKLILAGDDPCDLALNYGRAWTALGNLMPQLERLLVIRRRNLEVECDFEASETKVISRVDVTITLGRLLAAVFKFAFHALIELLKIKKKRKGGAET